MIHIQHRRFGPIVIAATVNSNLDVQMSWGFTENGATTRLLKALAS